MAAYMVVEHIITDAAKFEEYATKVGPILAKYGGRYLTKGGSHKMPEGGHWKPERVVIVEFDDMVTAQYRLVTEGLGLRHVRLVLGFSMGGMNAWLWGEKYPGFMDALAPMASQPSAMSSRNWMMRRLITDSIRNDPDWNSGEYTAQPRSVRFASVFYGIATAGGTLAYQKLAPTREAADKLLDERLAAPFTADANDALYQYAASGDYDPSSGLERIQATVLAINSADDERNPPETGITVRELKRIKNAQLFLIPASEDTRGHLTAAFAKFWKQQVQDLLAAAPRRGS